MSRRKLVIAAVFVSLAGTGCAAQTSDSAGDFSGEEESVAAAVEDLQEAGADQDAERICNDLLTQELARTMSKGQANGCADRVDTSLEDVDQFELAVKDVTVSGTRATARVEQGVGDQQTEITMALQKVGPLWKISDLGPR